MGKKMINLVPKNHPKLDQVINPINNLDINYKHEIPDMKLDKIKDEIKNDYKHDIKFEEENNKFNSKKSSKTGSSDKSNKMLKKDIDFDVNLENKLDVDVDNEKINLIPKNHLKLDQVINIIKF